MYAMDITDQSILLGPNMRTNLKNIIHTVFSSKTMKIPTVDPKKSFATFTVNKTFLNEF